MLKCVSQKVLLLLLLLPLAASAVGLGQFEVRSALGQPLDATIGLIGVSADEAALMSVGVASVAQHEKLGVERPYWVALFKFSVEVSEAGEPYIKITSKDPVREPYLNFLLEATSSTARLVKEVTAFIDPPTSAVRSAPVVSTPTAAAPTPSVPTAPPNSGTTAADIMMSSNPADRRYDANAATFTPTRYGDTLWAIALEIDSGSATPEQTLIGLIEANQDAFIAGNINNLMAGKTLRVPAESELLGIPSEVAADRVKLHNERWQKAKAGLPLDPMPPLEGSLASAAEQVGQVQRDSEPMASVGSETAPVAESESGLEAVDGAIDEAPAVAEANVPPAGRVTGAAQGEAGEESGQLKLLGGGAGGEDADGLSASGEALDAQLVEGDALKAQIMALEEQLQDMQRLLALKDEKLRLVEEQVAAGGTGDSAVGIAAPVETSEDGLSQLLNNPVVLGAFVVLLALLLLLLIAVVVLMRKLGSQQSPSFAALSRTPPSVVPVGASGRGEALEAAVEAEDEPAPLVGEGDGDETAILEPQFASSNRVSAPPQVEDVDPIAEAEVYLAYGRPQQAEEIIRDAVQSDPERLELKLKLLEIFYVQRKQAEFEQQAELVEPQVAESNEALWNEIRVMGHDLNPESPLFADVAEGQTVSGALVTADTGTDVLEIGLGDLDSDDLTNVESLDFGGDSAEEEGAEALDISLDIGDEEVEPTLTTEIDIGENVVDFDLGEPLDEVDDEITIEGGIDADLEDLDEIPDDEGSLDLDDLTSISDSDDALSFDIGDDTAADFADSDDEISEDVDLDLTEVGEEDDLDMDLDLDLTEIAGDDDSEIDIDDEPDLDVADPMSGKLDLARAYIEMGDKDAARELLEGVERAGSDEQAAEARRMLSELSS
ncbi:MAG: hypothetical protein J4A00_03945 [Gammaproteobacteria bacterium]|nr:hypothetical protein [Gammaproteobacteria bacterium]